MKTIGVLTSGGDAPGMNACVRAVVRAALANNMITVGIRRGYAGLLESDTSILSSRSVGGIARSGGTILQTARCLEFKTPAGIRQAVEHIHSLGIDGLVVIGGDGSLHGALDLHKAGIPVVGVPASIDNDIAGTDMAIGVDTAMNTILEALDKLKDTASAHQRAFLVEVMGRRSGYLALAAGVAGGAEMVLVPERKFEMQEILAEMARARERGKPHFIVVVAEGASPNAAEIQSALVAQREPGFEVRLTVLGHVQRGGSPTAFDRLLATRLGTSAVNALNAGKSGVMIGVHGPDRLITPIEEVLKEARQPDADLLELENMISL